MSNLRAQEFINLLNQHKLIMVGPADRICFSSYHGKVTQAMRRPNALRVELEMLCGQGMRIEYDLAKFQAELFQTGEGHHIVETRGADFFAWVTPTSPGREHRDMVVVANDTLTYVKSQDYRDYCSYGQNRHLRNLAVAT